MENRYIVRSLAKTIKSAKSKVIVLEGARAVGKTMLMNREFVNLGYQYFTLADGNTFRLASKDLESWVSDLPIPAIIDEAQRIPELPLAIKERVDGIESDSPIFILTGSASINKYSLGGQNPLTRRSRQLTLYPFTQRELAGINRSLIDDLWKGIPNESFRGSVSKDELRRRINIGGFPGYAATILHMSENERNLQIASDIDNVLGESILPDEYLDKTVAQTILQELLALPGGILNVSRLAAELHYDNRTIERYISIFTRRFLITALPNLRLAAHRQTIARAKIHPCDSSFTTNALHRAGQDPAANPSLFGGVFESFVANQILPEAQWSNKRAECFYWREPGKNPKEVDLVLLCDHKLIGIEVKSASTIRSEDFNGLRKLSEDDRFVRGFVVYTGDRFIKESDDLWAIPIAAFWKEGAFTMEEKPHEHSSTSIDLIPQEKAVIDASIFLSYCHEDNEHLDGAIIRLAQSIVAEYSFQFGSSLSLFTDVDSIDWGADWQRTLDQNIEATNFIMPSITPRYLKSGPCRDELTKFYQQTENSTNSMILSLVWQDVDKAGFSVENDIAYKIVKKHQYRNVADLQDLEPQDRAYKQRVRELVSELRKVIERNASEAVGSHPLPSSVPAKPTDEKGLLEKMAEIAEEIPSFEEACNSLLESMNNVVSTMSENPAPVLKQPAAFINWSAAIAQDTSVDLEAMSKNLTGINDVWLDLHNFIREAIEIASQLPNGPSKSELLTSIENTLEGIKRSSSMPPDVKEFESQLQMIQTLTPRLRPLATGFRNVFATFSSIESMTTDLLAQAKLAR
ncbi:DUF4143 domain-containing protein [Rubneribacter sp.]